jgi:carbonic anhydrase
MVDLSYPAYYIKDRCGGCKSDLDSLRDKTKHYERYGNFCVTCVKRASDGGSKKLRELEQDELYPGRERMVSEEVENLLKAAAARIRLKHGLPLPVPSVR